MKKRAVSILALSLCLVTLLCSCVTTYSLKLSGNGQGGGDLGGLGGGGTDGLGGLGGGKGEDFIEDHLFYEESFEGDIEDFSVNKSYFIADFDKNLSAYSGRGRYLFARAEQLSADDASALLEACLENDGVLVKLIRDEAGQSRMEYAVYALEEHPNMKRLAVVENGEELRTVSLYDYVKEPPENLFSLFEKEEPIERFTDEWSDGSFRDPRVNTPKIS